MARYRARASVISALFATAGVVWGCAGLVGADFDREFSSATGSGGSASTIVSVSAGGTTGTGGGGGGGGGGEACKPPGNAIAQGPPTTHYTLAQGAQQCPGGAATIHDAVIMPAGMEKDAAETMGYVELSRFNISADAGVGLFRCHAPTNGLHSFGLGACPTGFDPEGTGTIGYVSTQPDTAKVPLYRLSMKSTDKTLLHDIDVLIAEPDRDAVCCNGICSKCPVAYADAVPNADAVPDAGP